MKLFLLIPILLLANISVGQDSINQKDANGKKVGAWKIQAKQKNLVGFNPEEIYEEGNYKSGRKSGIWTRYYPGHRLKAKITYKNGRVGGKFWTYYENGMIEESGNLNGRNYIDTFQRFNRFGNLTMYKIFDQSGRIVTAWFEGMVPKPMMNNYKFYFKVDTSFNPAGNIDTITAFYPTGCIAEWIVYDNNQREVRHERYKNNCDTLRYLRGEYASAYLQDKRGSTIIQPAPTPIPPSPPPVLNTDFCDGYRKLYNDNKEIWQDGIFKDCRLKDGKFYVYNSDGILEKIEIYKNFKFVGNGVFED